MTLAQWWDIVVAILGAVSAVAFVAAVIAACVWATITLVGLAKRYLP